MTTTRQSLGRWGEQRAAVFLEQQGYEILGRNVRTAYGEIDLIARPAAGPDGSPQLVFIEVKTRRSTRYGLPEEALTQQKQAHLLAAISAYLQEHPEFDTLDWRVDVISILLARPGASQIKHFENALTG